MNSQFKVDDQFREHVSANLEGYRAQSADSTNKKCAAVAFTIVNRQVDANFDGISFSETDADKAAFILTARTPKLRNHAGQWAFPGGRIDAGESPEQSALRELWEEVGLELDPDNVLGRLDDYSTRSGYVITPIIVWGGNGIELRANPEEVESIHRIPMSELLRDDSPILESIPESEHPVLKMPLGDAWFAAPSAAVAYQFREVAILGKHTRVAHFEQPYFAWK